MLTKYAFSFKVVNKCVLYERADKVLEAQELFALVGEREVFCVSPAFEFGPALTLKSQ